MAEHITLTQALANIAALEDPAIRAVNEKHGDAHGVGLSALRGVAKKIKTDHELAQQLWHTGEASPRLLALLVGKPRSYSADELDSMVRQAELPKVHDWFVNYVAKKSPHAEQVRLRWFSDRNPRVAAPRPRSASSRTRRAWIWLPSSIRSSASWLTPNLLCSGR